MMSKKSRLKLLFKSLFVQFGQVQCDNGTVLLWDEDTELMVGYNVYVETENENGEVEYVAPENGEYVSNDTTFVIEDGKCVEIRNKEEEAPVEEQPAEKEETAAEEVPAEEPAQEQPAEEPEPEFDAQKAIEDMRAEYDSKLADMTAEIASLREQVETLLALPQDENAFNKESKNETDNKPLFKTKK